MDPTGFDVPMEWCVGLPQIQVRFGDGVAPGLKSGP